MDIIKERINQIDHKLRQVGGKMSMLKRQNMQLLAENVRLKKQSEKNKSNNFAIEKKEDEVVDESHVYAGHRPEEIIGWKKEIDGYIAEINTCIEDLDKL